MALLECSFFSESLELSTSMTVILPQETRRPGQARPLALVEPTGGKPRKTLYLLHGLSDDHTIWLRRTSIERYVAPLGLAVVMPEVHRSFYTDMAFGGAFETFVAEELPAIARSFFPLSDRREDTYIAGLSMGGYGAFKLALNHPESYCAAASLSGVLDIARRAADPNLDPTRKRDLVSVFGNELAAAGTRHDLFAVLDRLVASKTAIPRLYACCGEEDGLYEHNTTFRDFARKKGVELAWQSDPGYAHTWDYWDLRIQNVLEWMLGPQK